MKIGVQLPEVEWEVPFPELIEMAHDVAVERAKKFGRIGAYNSESRDWVASMALVEKHYPDYKE